jgi:hypothetical protein
MSILYFDGLLGLHIIFALIWIIASFLGVSTLLRVSKRPADVTSAKRAKTLQMVTAAAGGLAVLIGAGFYYYINFYRTAYATSSTGLPLVDAGAAIGLIAFAWQMAQGSRIRKSLTAMIASTGGSAGKSDTVQTANISNLPKSWMLITPAILLLVAIILMIGGTTM